MSTRELMARLAPMRAERDSRRERGVAVPPWLDAAIATMEAQLANEYNRVEADNLDEAQALAEQTPPDDWWRWYIAGAVVCLVAAAAVAWWPV